MPDLRGRAVYAAYRAGAATAVAIPAALGEAAAGRVGRVLGRAMRGRRRYAARHMRRASGGQLSAAGVARAVDGAFDSYGRYWFELFRLPHASVAEIGRRCRIDGYEHLAAALAAGKGAIVALPHLGGWEWAGAWMHAIQDHELMVVVEPVEPPELFEWFQRVRRAMGMEVVPAGDGAGARVLQALRANRIVCLVADRDLTGDGVDVEFFGERTTLPAGPALLALRSGAALMAAAVYFEGRGRHRGVIRPPIEVARAGRLRDDVARVTQAVAVEFESLIRAAPQQWHLMQPNWPSDARSGR